MKVGAVPVSSFPSFGYAIKASQRGRMSLPVAPSAYIYSHFKHISGVPAPEGVQGVTINKLKILDVLIEQLGRIRKQDGLPRTAEMPEERIDALISQYENQIKAASRGSAVPYLKSPSAFAGVMFNLVA